MDPRNEQGSFNDKLERRKMHPTEKLKTILEDIKAAKMKWIYDEEIKWLTVSAFSMRAI